MASVVVVGSCMVDLISYAPRLPQPGETLIGGRFQQGFGGKGANQCVAAARLGATTALVARLGDDSFGQEYLGALRKEGVNTEHVVLTPGIHTGMAQITVADNGENQIVIVPGSNTKLSAKDVQAASKLIESASILIFQMETPLETTLAALLLAKGRGKRIVNAAPACSNPDPRIYTESDIFCVNETEAEQMSGVHVSSVDDAFKAVQKFFDLGCNTVVVTLGAQGAVFASKDSPKPKHVPCKKVKPLDTTGAGDSFVGAMAYYLAYYPGLSLEEVVRRSCDIASESVQRAGTQTSFPHRADLPDHLF